VYSWPASISTRVSFTSVRQGAALLSRPGYGPGFAVLFVDSLQWVRHRSVMYLVTSSR